MLQEADAAGEIVQPHNDSSFLTSSLTDWLQEDREGEDVRWVGSVKRRKQEFKTLYLVHFLQVKIKKKNMGNVENESLQKTKNNNK